MTGLITVFNIINTGHGFAQSLPDMNFFSGMYYLTEGLNLYTVAGIKRESNTKSLTHPWWVFCKFSLNSFITPTKHTPLS